MRAICPIDPKHDKFYTMAHVAEEWLVDEHGDFLEVHERCETTHEPDMYNIWTCAICSATAKVVIE